MTSLHLLTDVVSWKSGAFNARASGGGAGGGGGGGGGERGRLLYFEITHRPDSCVVVLFDRHHLLYA